MKLVLNRVWGSFDLSDKALEEMGTTNKFLYERYDMRDAPELINAVEKLGDEASGGDFSNLVVFEIPDDITDYLIEDYDGYEVVYYCVNGKIKRT